VPEGWLLNGSEMVDGGDSLKEQLHAVQQEEQLQAVEQEEQLHSVQQEKRSNESPEGYRLSKVGISR
jgi:hypothetical protein